MAVFALAMAGAVLIIAHPGHELLVHHWMVRHRPTVLVLTDGSGGAGASRIAESLATVEAAGATAGPVFGLADDRRFYDAILAGDTDFFRDVLARIDAALGPGAEVVVSDAIEHFNPVHDLCSVLASLAARRARARPARYEFPIERPVDLAALGPGCEVCRLTPEDLARKVDAAALNGALQAELDRVRAEQPGVGAVEVLMPVAADRALLPTPSETPYYEVFGRARVASGRFTELITYAGHVAPLVEALAATQATPAA
jgi:hypothetical protein